MATQAFAREARQREILRLPGMAYANGPGGCRIWYEESGSGEPLLLIAGAATDHRMWAELRPRLEQRHRVLVYDHRGIGRSDAPLEPPYSIGLFAADAIAVLDTVGVSRAHVYGISMGGRIAQRLAIDYPERVAAVILGATTPGDRRGVRRPPEVDAKLRAAEPQERFRMLVDELYTPAFQAAHPEAVEDFRTWVVLDPKPPEILRLHLEASQGHDAWDELISVKAPVLVIHGTHDTVNPTANAPLLAERIPGAELHLIEGARHGYHVECHPAASEVVLAFLARHPLQA